MLGVPKSRIQPLFLQQLVVGATFTDAALLQHKNLVSILHR